MNQREYFDADYFERGWTKGTAYSQYSIAGASPLFRGIASTLIDVFRPIRVLEVGCATGYIVSQFNTLGCKAWGLDISEWAVRHAADPRVVLASADAIPFPDKHFDLVISCHAIEHLPSDIFETALAEMIRVCSGVHFHMLPIVGEGPYGGPVDEVVMNLQKDPTHQQLHDRTWWVSAFERAGARELPLAVPFFLDTRQTELSSSQICFLVDKGAQEREILARAAERVRRMYRSARQTLNQVIYGGGLHILRYAHREWRDVDARFGAGADFTRKVLRLLIVSDANSDLQLRLAVGDEAFANAAEFYVTVKPGVSLHTFTAADMAILRGTPQFASIGRMVFGGEASNAVVSVGLYDELGASLFSGR